MDVHLHQILEFCYFQRAFLLRFTLTNSQFFGYLCPTFDGKYFDNAAVKLEVDVGIGHPIADMLSEIRLIFSAVLDQAL